MIKILQQEYNPILNTVVAKYNNVVVKMKSVIKSFIAKAVSPAPFIAEENIIANDSKTKNKAPNLNKTIIVGLICSIIALSAPFEKGYINIFGINIYARTFKKIYKLVTCKDVLILVCAIEA
jgi:hypothetical protein